MSTLVFLLITGMSFAGLIVKPETALKELFPDTQIERKSFLLSKDQKKKIQSISRSKLPSSLFTVYLIKKDQNINYFGLLHSHRVRTKKETVLFVLDKKCRIKDIVIIAFYEPPEYKPSESWLKRFRGKSKDDMPVVKRNIPNITGSTLSSRVIARSARESIAICEVYLNEIYNTKKKK